MNHSDEQQHVSPNEHQRDISTYSPHAQNLEYTGEERDADITEDPRFSDIKSTEVDVPPPAMRGAEAQLNAGGYPPRYGEGRERAAAEAAAYGIPPPGKSANTDAEVPEVITPVSGSLPAAQQPRAYAYNAPPSANYGYSAPPRRYSAQGPADGKDHPSNAYDVTDETVPPGTPPKNFPGDASGEKMGYGPTGADAFARNSTGGDVPTQVHGIPLYGEDNAQLRDKFVLQGYKDVWAAIMFVCVFIITFIVGIWGFTKIKHWHTNGGKLFGLSLLLVILNIIVSAIGLFFFRRFPRMSIIVGNVFGICLMLLSAIVACVKGNIGGGIVMILFCIMWAVMFYLFRSRIPFSAVLLKTSSEIIGNFRALFLVALSTVGVFFFFIIFWAPAVFESATTLGNGTGGAGSFFLILFCIFTVYWTNEIASNVVHVTTAGLVATWYFVGGAQDMPPNPTATSLRRACTTSFGSICFGSLVVSLLNVIRYIVNSLLQSDNTFLANLVDCIMSCIEGLVEYFNYYAFVYCAIYGYGYIESAQKTMALARNCAFAAVFNDSIIGWTLRTWAMCFSFFFAAMFYIGYGASFGFLTWILSYTVIMQLLMMISSACTTLFVCFAEEPNTLAEVNPELYEAIRKSNVPV